MNRQTSGMTSAPKDERFARHGYRHGPIPTRLPLSQVDYNQAIQYQTHAAHHENSTRSSIKAGTGAYSVPEQAEYMAAWNSDCEVVPLRHDSVVGNPSANVPAGSFDQDPWVMAGQSEQHLDPSRSERSKEVFRCYEHGCNGRTFSNKDNYKRHLREQQSLTKVRCPFCDKDFSRKNNLDSHLMKGRCKTMMATLDWDQGGECS